MSVKNIFDFRLIIKFLFSRNKAEHPDLKRKKLFDFAKVLHEIDDFLEFNLRNPTFSS